MKFLKFLKDFQKYPSSWRISKTMSIFHFIIIIIWKFWRYWATWIWARWELKIWQYLILNFRMPHILNQLDFSWDLRGRPRNFEEFWISSTILLEILCCARGVLQIVWLPDCRHWTIILNKPSQPGLVYWGLLERRQGLRIRLLSRGRKLEGFEWE